MFRCPVQSLVWAGRWDAEMQIGRWHQKLHDAWCVCLRYTMLLYELVPLQCDHLCIRCHVKEYEKHFQLPNTSLCLPCIFKCLYSCGCILSFCVVLWNEHFVLKAHTATQILYRLAASLCFKQLIPHSNSAQPQPAWFIAETVTSIRINSHICASHTQTTPTPPAATLTPFKTETVASPPFYTLPSFYRPVEGVLKCDFMEW